jgi:hypothetical protein
MGHVARCHDLNSTAVSSMPAVVITSCMVSTRSRCSAQRDWSLSGLADGDRVLESLGMVDISHGCGCRSTLLRSGGVRFELCLIPRQLVARPMWLCALMIGCPLCQLISITMEGGPA